MKKFHRKSQTNERRGHSNLLGRADIRRAREDLAVMLVALIAVLLLLRSALYLLKSWQRKGGCNDQIIGFFHPFW